jgi:ribosome-binding factor A
MAKYKVYFEIYGKKMKTTVEAKTAEHAKELIRSKIQFNHIALEDSDELDFMKSFFKGFNGK